MTPAIHQTARKNMLYKSLKLIALNVAIVAAVIAAGHALSYLFGYLAR